MLCRMFERFLYEVRLDRQDFVHAMHCAELFQGLRRMFKGLFGYSKISPAMACIFFDVALSAFTAPSKAFAAPSLSGAVAF
jgi:hypothetical protein